MQRTGINIISETDENDNFLGKIYYLAGSNVFQNISIMVYKNGSCSTNCISVWAKFNTDFDNQPQTLNIFDQFRKSYCLNTLTTGRCDAIHGNGFETAGCFIKNFCKAENLADDSFDFVLDDLKSIFNNHYFASSDSCISNEMNHHRPSSPKII